MIDNPLFDADACIREAKAGNPNALGPVLAWLREDLRNVLRHAIPHNCRHKLQDSDLFQDVMVAVLEKFEQFRGDTVAALHAWIAELSRRLALDAVRNLCAAKRDYRREKSLAQQAASFDVPDRQNPDPAQAAIRGEEGLFLYKALKRLSEGDRELMDWSMRGVAISEIAFRLGVSLDVAYKRVGRARDRLLDVAEESVPACLLLA